MLLPLMLQIPSDKTDKRKTHPRVIKPTVSIYNLSIKTQDLLLLGRNDDNELRIILVHWWLIIIGDLLIDQQAMCLNILGILSFLSFASLEESSDSEDTLVGENDKERSEDTSGNTKEDWVQDDGDSLQNAVFTAVTEVVWATMVSLAEMRALSVMTWTAMWVP